MSTAKCADCGVRLRHDETPEEHECTGVSNDDMIATGATYRQIDYWTRRGYLTPEGAGPGSGYARRWSARDRDKAALMVRLARLGLDVEVAAGLADRLLDTRAPVRGTIDGVTLTIEWEVPA